MIAHFTLFIFLSLCGTISPRETHRRRDDKMSIHRQFLRDTTPAETVTLSKRGLTDGLLKPVLGEPGGSGLPSGLLNGIPHYDACHPDGPVPPSEYGDAAFTQGINSLTKSIVCPMGTNGPRGVVFGVPCTAGGGSETFARSPYGVYLPRQGFSVCWLEPPDRSTGDMQLTGEFVAFGIKLLASRAPEGVVNVVTYSQGGPNGHYALESFPSIRRSVKQIIYIAPPLKGTSVANAACGALAAAGGCSPATFQMSIGSRFMRALNSRADRNSGAQALVPSTSIFTLADELVVPQANNPSGVSFLAGAQNILLQQACPTAAHVEHFQMITDMAVFGLAFDALKNGRPANLFTFDRSFCGRVFEGLARFGSGLEHDLELTYRGLVGNTDDRLNSVVQTATTLRVPTEPLLQPHQCARGYAPWKECLPKPGFCQKPASEPILGGSTLPRAAQGAGKLLGDDATTDDDGSSNNPLTTAFPTAEKALGGILGS